MARKMKDSKIEWIGAIPETWKVYPAKFAFSEVRTKNSEGSVTNALKFYNGTIISKTNFDADSDDYVADTITTYTIVEPDTIMINGLNLNYDLKSLRVGLVKEHGVITSAYLALWPDKKRILPEYATYLFKGYEAKMAFHNMGAGIRKTLGFKEFKHQPILLPSMNEQQRIVAFLDTECTRIDSIIEQTRASIDEYKTLKQSIITQAVTKGIRPDRKVKDSGIEWIGEIPEEWECLFLKYVTAFQEGPGIMGNDFRNEGVPLIRISGVKGSIVTKAGCNYLDEETVSQRWNHFKLHLGDVVISASASTGIAALVDENCVGCIPYTGLIRFPITKGINNHFLRYYLLSDAYNGQINVQKTGTAIQHYGPTHINKVKIALPEYDEQVAIAHFLDNRCAEIDFIIQKKQDFLVALESYKKSLIYEYVTGKKEVPQ